MSTYPASPGFAPTDTSRAAADKIEPVAGTLQAEVYDRIKAWPSTCEEVEIALELSHQTASARIRELALYELIEDSGARRRNHSGRTAIVWRKMEPGA